MKKAYYVFIFLVIFLSACNAPPVAIEESLVVSDQIDSNPTEEIAAPTIESIERQRSSTPETSIVPTETTLPTIEPTSTPIPEEMRWHWVYSPETSQIQVVNQLGEIHSIGSMDIDEVYDYRLFRLNENRSLFFSLREEKPVVKLFGLDEIININIPGSFSIDRNMFLRSIQVVGNFDNFVYFLFATESSVEKDRSLYPSNGPLYQLDLDSLSINLIESNVYQDSFMDFRYYFYLSQEGSKIRYFKGQGITLFINELDFSNGTVRTIIQSTGSPNNVNGSDYGESFFLSKPDLFVTIDGYSKSFAKAQSQVKLLRSGEIIVFPSECYGPCQIEVVDPKTDAVIGNYLLPWSTQAYSRLGTRLLPDGTLIWVGESKGRLLKTPLTSGDFPDLEDIDSPVFRLSKDGSNKFIGVIREYDFEYLNRFPLSQDGRYILLKSSENSSYFIYDLFEDEETLSFPEVDNWNYDGGSVFFYSKGLLIQFYASALDEYSQFLSFLHFDSNESIFWEVPEYNILFCPDIFADGTIACWQQREDLNYDLVRFKPGTKDFTPLVENVYVLESIE